MENAKPAKRNIFQKIADAVPRDHLKLRLILMIVFAALVFAYVFAFMPRTTFQYNDNGGAAEYMESMGEITAQRPVEQPVRIKTEEGVLKGLEIAFEAFERRNHAEYNVDLLDAQGIVLAHNTFNADKVEWDAPFGVPLPDIPVKKGEVYTLRIWSDDAAEGNALGLMVNTNPKNKAPDVTVGGETLDGSMHFRLGYESWSQNSVIGATILVAAVALAILFWGKKLHVNTLVLVLVFGVMFALITPVTDTPDEQVHTATAFLMADGNFVTYSGVPVETADSYNTVVKAHLRPLYSSMMSGEDAVGGTMESAWGTGRLALGFLPQTIGLWIARLLQMDLKGAFYLGRIFNVFAYAVFAFFAVKKAAKFKLHFSVLALMPMALIIAGSYNPDALTYGLALLLAAWFVDFYYNKSYQLSWKKLIPFGVILLLLLINKFSLCAFAMLPFFIPASRYQCKKTKWLGSFAMLAAGAAAVLFAVWWTSYSAGGTSAVSGGEVTERGANATQQLLFLLQNPGTAASIFSKTISRELGANLMQMFSLGHTMTYSVFPVIAVCYFAFVAVVAFAYTRYEYQPELARGNTPVSLLNRAMLLVVILLTILLTYLALYLTWTPVGADTVEGVQGRYFVPLFLLLPFLGQNAWPLVEKGQHERSRINIQFVAVLFSAVTLLTTLLQYY